MAHSRRFEAVAQRGRRADRVRSSPFTAPLKELQQEPTAREIEVLQLIFEGLVNREIGHRLFLSEETVKSLACVLRRLLRLSSIPTLLPHSRRFLPEETRTTDGLNLVFDREAVLHQELAASVA